MAHVVYTGVNGQSELKGSLFEGQKFWFSQKVPQRQWFVEQVESNGGVVVPLEKQADVKLVDHTRKDLPPDTYSYKYVELSIRNRQREDLKDHAAGPPAGTIRSVGSTTMPAKGTRNYYSTEDDRVLWDWVIKHEHKNGYISGNEIYKQLEEVNPRHPWQSWRDRWIKTLSSRPRPTQRPEDMTLTPTSNTEPRMKDKRAHNQSSATSKNKQHKVDFTEDDAMVLLKHAEDILDVGTDQSDDAWAAWARANPEHTAEEWQDFFEKRVRPIYNKKVKKSKKQQVKSVKDNSVSGSKADLTLRPPHGETSLMVSPLPNRMKKAISPELEPQYLSLRSTEAVHSRSLNHDDQFKDVRVTASMSDRKDTAKGSISPKRKRDSFEEVASSSPIFRPDTPMLNKRPRYEQTDKQITEIPSTPERSPTPIPINSTSPHHNLDSVIDLEDNDDLLGLPASQSLSEPDRSGHTGKTTTTNPDRPLTLDYDLPSPEGGWDGEDLLVPPIEVFLTEQRQGNIEDTQQLLTAQTQIPDFSVPEPDGGWDTIMPSSPLPTSPSQSNYPAPRIIGATAIDVPEACHQAKSNSTTELNAWIQTHLKQNIPSNLITQALKSTTMDPILAKVILDDLVEGKGIPGDMAGVWTEQDDKDLRANDGRRVKRVTEKHGTEGFYERWQFLEDWDQA